MDTQHGEFKWTAIAWAALLMFVIPMAVSFLVPAIYGTYIGFSTRGDMTRVNEGVAALTSSPLYQVSFFAVFAAVALWRGYVLAKKVTGRLLLHLGLAVLVAALLVAAYFLMASAGNLAAIWDETLIAALMLVGGAYLGSLLKPSKPAPA